MEKEYTHIMPKLQSSKSASPPAVEKDITQTSFKTAKKQRSLRTLFSFWKSSKKAPSYPNSEPASKEPRFSTASLPARVPTRESSDSEGSDSDSPRGTGYSYSTASLPSEVRPPFARHAPSSSSSSASSLEFPSDTSTAATSPSNSSPSILIKPLSSSSIATMNLTASVADALPVERNSPPKQASQTSIKLPKPVKRPTDSYQKQPSPLSSVMDAHSSYTFPVPPSMSRHESQPMRRTSLGRFLLRRTQSHTDLADLTQEYLPPLPPMPESAPSSRPGSSSPMARAKNFRRRSSDHRKPDNTGSYTEGQKIERMSILGADPAGYGYYLYPTSKTEAISQKNNAMGPPLGRRGRPGYVDDWKRNSWGSGSDGGRVSNTGPSSKAWKDTRGRSFRRTVTQAIPEEAGDAFDSNEMGSRTQLEEKKKRMQCLHNSWDSIRAQKQIQELSSLKVPSTGKKVEDCGENAILRRLQQGAQRAMDAADSAAEGLGGKILSFSQLGTEGSETKDGLPVIRVDMAKA